MDSEKPQAPTSPRKEKEPEVESAASATSEEKPKEAPKEEKKVEAPKEEKPKEPVKTQQPPQDQSGGWGSWGNWWSSAATVVTQSVSSITETTKELVKELVNEEPEKPVKLYRKDEDIKAEEEEKKKEKAEEKPQKLEDKVHEQRMVKDLPDGKQEQTQEGDIDLLSVVDKGFSMIGDGVDKLGNLFGQGLNKVVESAPEIQAKAKDFASQSIEMAKQTAEKGRKVGEKLAVQGVDALESVGKHALTYLTVEEEVSGSKKRLRPVFIYNSTPATHMTKEELASFEDSLNRNYFDESNGTALLQELEKISIECTLKFQKLEQKIVKTDPKLREELTTLLNKVKEIFETEENSEKSNPPDVPLNEVATKHREALDSMAKLAHSRAMEVIDGFKQELKEFKPEENNSTILTATDICHLTASYMDKTLLESVSRLNQFSANTVEQILRIVESYLIELDSAKLEKDDVMKRVEYIFFISQMLIEEITNISNAFIDAIKALGEEAKSNFTEYSNKGDAEKEESNKCAEDIDTKMNLHVNHIYLDTSNAVSNVEDCRKFLFPISKSLAGSTFHLPKEETQ